MNKDYGTGFGYFWKKFMDGWRHLVLTSGPEPAWLRGDAPAGDIVVSSRARLARNVWGHRFVHRADTPELKEIEKEVIQAAQESGLASEVLRQLSPGERDYLVNARLVSPDFDAALPHRSLLLDENRSLSLMVNEEDHVRLQVIVAGWNPKVAHQQALGAIHNLEQRLPFSRSETLGYLTASPSNCGDGARISAHFHLIGLAKSGRLAAVFRALRERRVVVRGPFGEKSRPVAGFFQVSMTQRFAQEFFGAGEFLIQEERRDRELISSEELHELTQRAIRFAVTKLELSYKDALEVLATLRWASSSGLPGYPGDSRSVDRWFVTLESRTELQPAKANRRRADQLREFLEPFLEKS